ncbi:hypothetical protein SS50377_20601 [Spironucleus salmonicida]|uniref:Uncharacterized protein n=1 Tax=Spironucleus salmonicida TaxID=348837 RepID=V6LQ82_9EUKA|nr:hypothetical protein SS50377_20601 [Spironucleus salmonicida]|eukprot:EST45871.1 Hypothetical protein SS50377_14158 [Spironucleus salmonicida]
MPHSCFPDPRQAYPDYLHQRPKSQPKKQKQVSMRPRSIQRLPSSPCIQNICSPPCSSPMVSFVVMDEAINHVNERVKIQSTQTDAVLTLTAMLQTAPNIYNTQVQTEPETPIEVGLQLEYEIEMETVKRENSQLKKYCRKLLDELQNKYDAINTMSEVQDQQRAQIQRLVAQVYCGDLYEDLGLDRDRVVQ